MTNKLDDEIIEEIRRRRQLMPSHSDYDLKDLKRITKDLQRQERESDKPVVQRQPRKPQLLPKRSSV